MNKKLALLLAVLMLVVVVAGCGKSEPAKPAQPAAKAEPIIIAYTAWVYKVMSGPVTAKSIDENPNAY